MVRYEVLQKIKCNVENQIRDRWINSTMCSWSCVKFWRASNADTLLREQDDTLRRHCMRTAIRYKTKHSTENTEIRTRVEKAKCVEVEKYEIMLTATNVMEAEKWSGKIKDVCEGREELSGDEAGRTMQRPEKTS